MMNSLQIEPLLWRLCDVNVCASLPSLHFWSQWVRFQGNKISCSEMVWSSYLFPLMVFKKRWTQLSPKHWRSCRGQQLLPDLQVMDVCWWWALLAQRAPSPARAAVPCWLPFLWSTRGLQPLAHNQDLQLCSWVLSGGWEGEENTPKTVINTIWRILSALCVSESGDQDTK